MRKKSIIVIFIMAFIMPFYKVNALTIEGDIDYDDSNNLLMEINNYREENEMSPLFYDKDLSVYAIERAQEISILYDNVRLDGSNSYDGFEYENSVFIENIFDSDVDISTISGNILDDSIKSIGIGSFLVNGNKYYVVIFSDYVGTFMNMDGSNHIIKKITGIDSAFQIDFDLSKKDILRLNEYIDYNNVIFSSNVLNIDNMVFNNNDVNFKSSDINVIDIDDNNVVRPVKIGKVKLTVSFMGIDKEFEIDVRKNIPDDLEIELSADSVQLNIDSSYQVDVSYNYNKEDVDTSINWSSENNDIASVDDKGEIFGVSNGDTNISACLYNGFCKNIDVKVRKYLEDIFYMTNVVNIDKDEDFVVNFVTDNKGDYRKYINFEVLDSSIISINKDGVIKGISKGNTTLYIGYYNNYGEYIKKGIKVNVKDAIFNDVLTSDNKEDINNNYSYNEVSSTINSINNSTSNSINNSTNEIVVTDSVDNSSNNTEKELDNKDSIDVYDEIDVVDKDKNVVDKNKVDSNKKKDKNIDDFINKMVRDLWKKSVLGYVIITIIILFGFNAIKRLIKMMKIKL